MDQTERAVQAQWYLPKVMNAQNARYINKTSQNKGIHSSKQDKSKQSGIAYALAKQDKSSDSHY